MSAGLPPPPRRGRRARAAPAGRPAPLTRERIVDAALAVVDAGGLDALSMRTVATALRTGPASLYAHVTGREELLALMVERVAERVALPEPDADHWQEQTKAIVRGLHAGLLEHRDLARGGLGTALLEEGGLQVTERLIAVLALGGLPRRVIGYAAALLPLYAVATAGEQALLAERAGTEDGARYLGEVDAYRAALPPDRFPHLAALAAELAPGAEGERFEFGLDVLVAGLAAYGRRASTA